MYHIANFKIKMFIYKVIVEETEQILILIVSI